MSALRALAEFAVFAALAGILPIDCIVSPKQQRAATWMGHPVRVVTRDGHPELSAWSSGGGSPIRIEKWRSESEYTWARQAAPPMQ